MQGAQEALHERHGPTWNADGFVLVSRKGTRLVARAGPPPMRFHDLRHCAASPNSEAHAPLVVWWW